MAGATQEASEVASERRKQSFSFTAKISVPEGADYLSEIRCRCPSIANPRHKETRDNILMFLRNLISKLDPEVPELLDRFTADANAILDFLAHFGLDDVDLRCWEALCREVEFLIRQLKSLTIVRTKSSVSDLRECLRIRQEAADLAHDEFEKSAEAIRIHSNRSASIEVEIENLSSKIKNLWEEIKSLESRKMDLQVELDKHTRVTEREQRHYQICHQAMLDAEVALTQALEDLQIAETEHQSFATIMSHL